LKFKKLNAHTTTNGGEMRCVKLIQCKWELVDVRSTGYSHVEVVH